MLFGWKKRCRQLESENAQLKAQAAQLEARLTEAQAKNQQLVQALAAARKTSRNSSKRPSSDIVKPPPKPLGKGKRRKIGAQPGHTKSILPPPNEEIKRTFDRRGARAKAQSSPPCYFSSDNNALG